MVPRGLHVGNLHHNLLDLRGHFEKLVTELQKALLKSHEQKKDLETQLEESENKRKELNKVVLHFEGQIKDLKNDLEQSEAKKKDLTEKITLAANAKELWDTEKTAMLKRIEVLTKERQNSTCKYNQALKERNTALSDLKNLRAELEEVRKDLSESQADLELGKKVWQAERIALAARLANAKEVWKDERMELTRKLNNELNKFAGEINELREELSDFEKIHKQHIQENENVYCAGYLTGWFKEPHAYMALPSHEAKKVTLPDYESLEARSPLSHGCALSGDGVESIVMALKEVIVIEDTPDLTTRGKRGCVGEDSASQKKGRLVEVAARPLSGKKHKDKAQMIATRSTFLSRLDKEAAPSP